MNPVINFHDYRSKDALDAAFPPSAGGPGWVYVGRSNQTHKLPQSPLANRFVRFGKAQRRGVIEAENPIAAYRAWLIGKIRENDGVVMEALRNIGPKTALVCWCSPMACHAGVIAEQILLIG